MTLTRDVEALRDRRAPLEMTGAEFRDAGHRLVDRIADWLAALPDGPVTRDESPADVRRAREGRSRAAGIRHRRASTARRGGRAAVRPLALQRPSALLRLHHVEPGADRRARRSSGVGRQPERRGLAAGAGRDRDRSADRALDCGADRVSRPRPAGCWSAAATWRTSSASSPRAPPRRRRTCEPEGCDRVPAQLRVYASTETHTWIQKAADLFGLGTDAIRWIATDDQQRMDPSALDAADRGGLEPRRPAVSGRRHGRIGQHRRGRSAAGDRGGLPAA